MSTSKDLLQHSVAAGDAQAIIDAAREGAKAEQIADQDGVLVFAVPDGATVREVDLGKFADKPRHASGAHHVATVASFVALVERLHSLHTTIWAHPTAGTIVAVINDHGKAAAAAWGDLRVTLTLEQTPAWKRWIALDGKRGTQQTFAEHLEESIVDIVEPDGATLLEVAQSFHAKGSVQFRAGQRLTDGTVQLQYDEEVEASAGRMGEIPVPSEFTVSLAPFIGEEAELVTARLRYKVTEGNLAIGYKLDRPDDVVRAVLDRVREGIVEQFGSDTVFVSATPPAARR